MPLLESKRAPRNPSFRSMFAGQTQLLLTGSIIAAALAVLSLVKLLRDFNLPLWVALVAALLVVILALFRAGLQLQNQLQELTARLYRYHPTTDEGIDVEQVLLVPIMGLGHQVRLQVRMRLMEMRFSEILVTCDGPVGYSCLKYPLPAEERIKPDKGRRIAGPVRGTNPVVQVTPNSFTATCPPYTAPIETYLEINGEPPPAVIAIEWVRGERKGPVASAPQRPS